MENETLRTEITRKDEMEIEIFTSNNLEKKLESLPSLYTKTRIIHKVPDYIRKGSEDQYRPSVVSIGPIFYKDKRLKSMEEVKLGYLKYFLAHEDNGCPKLQDYINYVRDKEQKIRDRYEEHIRLSSDEFIQMIVIDAVFLICYFKYAGKCNDPSLGMPLIASKLCGSLRNLSIIRDVLIVENQLPFFILNHIFDMAFSKDKGHTLYSLTLRSICGYIGIRGDAIDKIIGGNIKIDPLGILNVLDLLTMSFHRSILRDQQSENELEDQQTENEPEFDTTERRNSKTAKQLKDAGVKFVKSVSNNIFDITFADGKLAIPRFFITDTTECTWRNMLYFEQSNPGKSMIFTDYVLFLDALVDTVEDVQVLVDSNILHNGLGSNKDAVRVFNKVCRNWVSYNGTYDDVSKRANGYASTPWNQWMATLRTKYFYNPWVAISVFAAFMLFVLTLLQTVASYVYN